MLSLTGFFSLSFGNHDILVAIGAASFLGVVGTAVATVIFYTLVKRAGGIFASMVTYGIPFIAIGWGLVFGEKLGYQQVLCLMVILLGVYLVNKKINSTKNVS